MNLTGKVAIVTGASSGIGFRVSQKLAEAGAQVAMIARNRENLYRAATEIGPRAHAFPLDVTDLDSLIKLPDVIAASLGRLDIVVNNAGLNHRGPMMGHSPLALADVITTDLTAPIVLSRAAAPLLPAGGAIVNVASLAGMVPVPDEAAYSAAKAGLRAFTRAVAEELPHLHIGSVCPGPVDTPFFGDVAKVPNLVFSQPMSTATEVADAILQCIAKGRREVALPSLSGKLCTVGYIFPKLAKLLRPMLERRGARRKERYLQAKGLV